MLHHSWSNYKILNVFFDFQLISILSMSSSESTDASEYRCCLIDVDINIEEYFVSKSSTLYNTCEVSNQVQIAVVEQELAVFKI